MRSKDSLNVALVSHNIIRGDGQGRANYELVRYLLKQGHAVTIYGDRVAPELAEEGARWVPIHTRLRATDLSHGLEFAAKADRLLKTARRDFDIIHGCGHTMNLPQDVSVTQFVHSAWLNNPQHVSRTDGLTHRAAYQYTYSWVNGWLERKVYARARRVVAVSEQIRQELVSMGVAPEKLSVINNGADLDEFKPGAADRATWNLPSGVPLALFAGDLRTRRKNMDTILAALVKVPELHLVAVGKVENSPFPEMARALQVADRVHFVGFRRDIADLMRAADFFVFPSRYEAFALVLIEALASGLPVITAKTTGGAEVITPEAGVLLDDPNDVEALVTALRMLTNNATLRGEMGRAARTIALANSWDKIGAAHLAGYEKLLTAR